MLTYLKGLAAPMRFYHWCARLAPWLGACTALLLALGWWGGLVLAPADYQQGDGFRIIYVHVPSAWMSLFVYVIMAGAGVVALIWRVKIAEVLMAASAPIGAWFTFLALATGSIWGKPMWGTYWVWDARLTSELILLFLYLGVIALLAANEDRRRASRAAAVLALVGVVNIPIIHYSVQWWSTLHQGPSVGTFGAPSIHPSMLVPLLVTALAFKLYYLTVLLLRARCEIVLRERNSAWVRELISR